MRVHRLTLPATAVLLAVAGCSSGGAPAAGSSPAASSAPADGGSYPDVDAILAALQANGAPCVGSSPIANPTLTGAESMTDCGSSPGVSDSVVVVFDSQAHALAYAVALTSGDMSAISAGSTVVYGRDWAVNTSSAAYADTVKRVLGGQVVAGPSASAP